MRDYYDRQKAALRARMAKEGREHDAMPMGASASWLENRQIPLGAEVSEHPAVAALVQRYKQDVARLPAPTMLAAAGGGPVAAGGASGSAGAAACGGCYAAALAFRQTTKHARALQALVDRGEHKNAACVGCHS